MFFFLVSIGKSKIASFEASFHRNGVGPIGLFSREHEARSHPVSRGRWCNVLRLDVVGLFYR